MASHLVYRRLAIVLPIEQFGTPIFAALQLGGDRNVRDHQGRRARDWYTLVAGTAGDVMREVVRVSADCEGRMLQEVIHGTDRPLDVRPEAFIRRWRLAMATPLALVAAIAEGYRFEARIDLVPEALPHMDRSLREHYERLCALVRPEPVVEHGNAWLRFAMPFDTADSMRIFFDAHWMSRRAWSEKLRVVSSPDPVDEPSPADPEPQAEVASSVLVV